MKNRGFANSLIVMVFAIVALATVGCDNDEITGGGWIVKDNGKKATFGLQLKCDSEHNGGAKVSGQFQYNDHDKGIRFHAVADSVSQEGTCNGLLDIWEGEYCGSYTPQPRRLGEGGRFTIYLKDNGERGPSKGDKIRLTLEGGIYDAYFTEATLEGGNIQAHGAKMSE